MKRVLSVSFLPVFFALIAQYASGLTVAAPERVVLGDAISVQVPYSPQMSRVTVALVDSEGRVMGASPAFPYPEGNAPRFWVSLVGVPTTIRPGAYVLDTRVVRTGSATHYRSPIEVLSRSFRSENIALDQSLSDLQKEQTPLKTQQANALWKLLTTFRPQAIFQTAPFILPVDNYVVTSPFGERRNFVFVHGGRQASVHQGIDMAVPAGTPVKAAGAGEIVFAGPLVMTGNTVVIEHLPGVYSLYFHMERLLVRLGQEVTQGQSIGLVGSTGLATGPHLHWQVEVNGVAVNPLSLLKQGLVGTRTAPTTR